VIAAQNDDLLWEAHFESKEKADDLATLLASVHVVPEEQILQVSAEDLLLLLLLVLVCHLLEHMEEVTVLAMDVAEYLNRCLEQKEWFLLFENFLSFLQKEVDDFLWQVNKWYILRVLSLVVHYFIVKVVDDNIHNKFQLVLHICLGDLLETLLELLTPYLLDVE